MTQPPGRHREEGSEWHRLRHATLLPIAGAIILIAYVLLATGASLEARDDSPAVPVMFETSNVCMGCHNDLVTSSGEDVSIGSGWRGSMMANAARDPYWQAAVRREILDHPPAAAAIENECSTCHMPMAHYRARVKRTDAKLFAHLPVLPTPMAPNRDAVLAADGVGCATCHQITDENLGTRASFVGGFVIDRIKPAGQRVIYGPFDVDPGLTRIMQSASAFIPKKGEHIQDSELCASCHTLITHALDENHQAVGELPEQVPYLEWLHSGYANEKSCQSCHMPIIQDSVEVSSVLGPKRSNVNRHSFRGGNFLIPRMLNRYKTELGVNATATELDASVSRTLDHLKTRAASVRVDRVRVGETGLSAVVTVTNHAGHKLPTAYPSRRVWLHVTITDHRGDIVFESGELNPDGSIAGNDNDFGEGAFEPHYRTITGPDQVQVYEAIMVDPKGTVTTGLTSGIRYVKDNRILPKGFDKQTADSEIAVHGLASEDADFVANADVLRYEVGLDPANGPFEVRAELLYQPIGYRWAMNLRDYDAMETQRFVDFYKSLSHASAVVMTSDTWSDSVR